jgi:hypothetical protein
MDKPTEATYTWLILNTAHGKYICGTKHTVSHLLQLQIDGAAMECEMAYELITPVNQVPSADQTKFGIAKEAVATPLDVNSEACNTFFSLVGTRMTFFEHMSKSDRTVYEQLINMANSLGTGWRAHRAGITFA